MTTPTRRYHRARLEILQIYGLTERCGPAEVIARDDPTIHIGCTAKAFSTPTSESSTTTATTSRQVLVSGGFVMAGYWNRPADTAATINNGWLSAGDIAVRDAADGFIFIGDRIKDMIISGDENVYPAGIEDLIPTSRRPSTRRWSPDFERIRWRSRDRRAVRSAVAVSSAAASRRWVG